MSAKVRKARLGAIAAAVFFVSPAVGAEKEVAKTANGQLADQVVAQEEAALEADRREESRQHLKRIGLAIHTYQAARNQFPARASYDKSGKPLLSWRVHLLPYLDEANLYRQFKLDEPWDSPHNKKLIARMPDVFKNSSVTAGHGKTDYLVPVGKGTMFGRAEALRVSDITDGLMNTIMVVEANQEGSVVWTRPDDLPYDPGAPMKGLGSVHREGFLALMADGSVRFVSKSIAASFLQKLFTHAGGENVSLP